MTILDTPAIEPERELGEEEREYLLKRADDHRRLAAMTEDAGSRSIHLRMEQMYDARAQQIAIVSHN